MEVEKKRISDCRPTFVPWRRNLTKYCSWTAHRAKVVWKGRAHVGKMDAIQTDSLPDARVEICILTTVIAPKPEFEGEACEGNAISANQLETVQTTAAAKKSTRMPKYDE